jgi:hypothetical protein
MEEATATEVTHTPARQHRGRKRARPFTVTAQRRPAKKAKRQQSDDAAVATTQQPPPSLGPVAKFARYIWHLFVKDTPQFDDAMHGKAAAFLKKSSCIEYVTTNKALDDAYAEMNRIKAALRSADDAQFTLSKDGSEATTWHAKCQELLAKKCQTHERIVRLQEEVHGIEHAQLVAWN